jgi:glucose-1-phosphate adenylyltransferase
VSREEASSLGIMRIDEHGRIVEFVEKPKKAEELDRLTLDQATIDKLGLQAEPGTLLASMGIYVFKSDVLQGIFGEDQNSADFGKEIIPAAISRYNVFAYLYYGYWRDIGTIPAFHEANLELTQPNPPLNLYHPDFPIYTHARFLPGTKVQNCQIEHSVLCEGSVLQGSRIVDSVIGIRSMVWPGTVLEETILMGTSPNQTSNELEEVRVGVGRNCHLRRTIVDTGARIGDGCRLLNEAGIENADAEHYCIRGGIIVVPAFAVVPPGTVV